MSTTTTNYSLVKPAPTDVVDIEVINSDLDVIDAAMRLSATATGRNLKDFGAVGDNSTNNVTAFNAAIANANALLGDDRPSINGRMYIIPEGRYHINAALNPVTVSGIEFVGQGQATVLVIPPNVGTVFTLGDASLTRMPVGLAIRNLKIEYTGTPASTDSFCTLSHVNEVSFTDLQLVQVPTFLNLGTSATAAAGGILVDRVVGSIANVGAPVFKLNYGAGLRVDNTAMFVSGVLTPTHPTDMTTVAGTDVIHGSLTGGAFWDTLMISNTCSFERFYRGLNLYAGSGAVFQNMWIDGVWDYTRSTVIRLESPSGGVISGVRTTKDCWMVAWESYAIYITGAGYNDNHELGGTIPISGIAAVWCDSPNAKCLKFTLQIGSVGQKTEPAAAMMFRPSSTGFIVQGCAGHDDLTGSGLPWRAAWGLAIGVDCDNYIVTGNRLSGYAAAGNIGGYNNGAVHSSGSVNRLMTNNLGAGYAGYDAAFTPAASAVVNTNKTDNIWEVSIYGGTVTAIAKNGTTITGMTSGTLRIAPGETFTITYSSVPSVTKFILE